MAQRRFHYEQAFEHYLRANHIPAIAVDEAKRALQPRPVQPNLKNFDFVVHSPSGLNLLIDVKGRKITSGKGKSRGNTAGTSGGGGASGGGGFQNWVTADDVDSLIRWQSLFGSNFQAVFVFLFWCEAQPPDALFQEIFEYHERWYVMRVIRLADYQCHMRVRSPKWKTVHLPTKVFRELAQPLANFL